MLSFFYLILIPSAMAFPEMIRHHYVNCSACHISNSGGGLLNSYGRSISYEVLSSFGSEKESRAFYSIDPDKISEWLSLGGDLRGLQVHQENEQVLQGRFIWMEANLQAAAKLGKFTTYLSAGQVEQSNQSLKLTPTKYYVSYQVSDELSLKVGRYIPIYGLNIPQHTFLIRQNLQLGPGSERNAIDIQWNGEKYNFAVGVSKSLIDSAVRDEELALNFQAQYNLHDQHKLGLNYWYGEANNYKKIKLGLQAVLGWSEKFYTLTEFDHLWSKDNKDFETKSLFELLKTGYEFYKGLHFQAVQEWGKIDAASSTETQSLGAGFLWYPRPHFELESLWSKRKIITKTDLSEDYAYLLLHFYF